MRGDALHGRIVSHLPRRLAVRNAVLRLPGASKQVDNDVRQAQGLPVYYSLEQMPGVAS